ncbi:MAG: BolA family protein [Pseudomonadales bacterium]
MNNPGPIANRIESELSAALPLAHLQVINESDQHNVPPGSESHFKVVLVSEAFAESRLLARHRRVNDILAAELAAGVHALSIHAYSPDEWHERFGDVPLSPPCLGGGAAGGSA